MEANLFSFCQGPRSTQLSGALSLWGQCQGAARQSCQQYQLVGASFSWGWPETLQVPGALAEGWSQPWLRGGLGVWRQRPGPGEHVGKEEGLGPGGSMLSSRPGQCLQGSSSASLELGSCCRAARCASGSFLPTLPHSLPRGGLMGPGSPGHALAAGQRSLEQGLPPTPVSLRHLQGSQHMSTEKGMGFPEAAPSAAAQPPHTALMHVSSSTISTTLALPSTNSLPSQPPKQRSKQRSIKQQQAASRGEAARTAGCCGDKAHDLWCRTPPSCVPNTSSPRQLRRPHHRGPKPLLNSLDARSEWKAWFTLETKAGQG